MRGVKVVVILTAIWAANAWGQEAAEEKPPWTHKLVGNLAANQVALKDWSQGGDDAFSWGITVDGKAVREKQLTLWTTTYKFAFGQTKLGDQEIRKTTDQIDLETILTYKLDKYINPYVATTAKTQFFKGYNYTSAGKVAVARFMDPAYLTQSAGAGFTPRSEIKTRLGVALREIITRDFNHYADDKETLDEVEKIRVDGGMESVTNGEWQLKENVLLTSKLEIFAPFTALDEISVRSDNTVMVKLIRYVTLNVSLLIVDDATASDELQVKQATALGLSYTFL